MGYIELKAIEKSFGEKSVLKHVSLSVEKGEFVSFLGPSGCGKTTLLRCLVGLTSVDSGAIFLDGREITAMPAGERGISMIFQHYSLFPTMNVHDNVSFGLRMKSLPKKEIHSRVHRVLGMVDMLGHDRKYPYQLSGGEQQRVALARCLIMNPSVLLLDEPLSAIDAKLRKELQLYLKQIHKELGMTSIFVTHDQEEAMRVADTIHVFNGGVLEQSGSPPEIYAQPKTPFVAGFIGNYNQIGYDVFKAIVGCDVHAGQMVAIRPETIKISATPFELREDSYYATGEITGFIPQGNVIRYAVSTGRAVIDVDVIFDSGIMWSMGQPIFLRMRKEHVLSFHRN